MDEAEEEAVDMVEEVEADPEAPAWSGLSWLGWAPSQAAAEAAVEAQVDTAAEVEVEEATAEAAAGNVAP